MALTSIGDLALNFVLRNRNTELRQTLTRLGDEATSGSTTDPVGKIDGHLSYLSGIEHDLVLVKSFDLSAKEVEIAAARMQSALTRIADKIGDKTNGLFGTLVLASTSAGVTSFENVATDARDTLESIVSALNTDESGRHLFSGVDVTTAPLASADTILAKLKAVISGATGADEAVAMADAFFDTPGGGFESEIYKGAADGLAPVRLGAGESVDLDLRADNAPLRATIKHVALAALIDDQDLALNDAGRREMISTARDGLLAAKDAQVSLQADLGFAENRIAQARARIETEKTTLALAKTELLEVDPYKAATELKSVTFQLESLYAVTERASRLSLVRYLS